MSPRQRGDGPPGFTTGSALSTGLSSCPHPASPALKHQGLFQWSPHLTWTFQRSSAAVPCPAYVGQPVPTVPSGTSFWRFRQSWAHRQAGGSEQTCLKGQSARVERGVGSQPLPHICSPRGQGASSPLGGLGHVSSCDQGHAGRGSCVSTLHGSFQGWIRLSLCPCNHPVGHDPRVSGGRAVPHGSRVSSCLYSHWTPIHHQPPFSSAPWQGGPHNCTPRGICCLDAGLVPGAGA